MEKLWYPTWLIGIDGIFISFLYLYRKVMMIKRIEENAYANYKKEPEN